MVLFLHKSMTISLNFLQCPPRWTTLQVIISPGKNPLPALALIKYSTDGDHEQFYALATPHMQDPLPMQHHVYKDPVQREVREILARSFITFFEKFEYQQDPLTKLYGVEFPRHHEQMLLDYIIIVKKECEYYITSTQRYGSGVQLLKKALSTITTGKLANLIVDCTDTIRSKKNWNSHGATLGLAICQISSIISSLGKASEEAVRPNFNELIPCGVVHTGHKYGNTHSVCTEYMVSTCES